MPDDATDEISGVYVFVDGSNIAYDSNSQGEPHLSRIQEVLDILARHSFEVRTFVDASLRHHIDDPEGLEVMIADKRILQAPARTDADDFLLYAAKRVQDRGGVAYVLTNDLFPVKRLGGTVPRVTHVAVPVGGRNEWLFHPPLETLEEPEADAVEEPAPVGVTGIDGALMSSLCGFLVTQEPPVSAGDAVPFAKVAGYLHNQWDGNFCQPFGYRKPKDFALALEREGLVEVERRGSPIYLQISEGLMEECERHSLEVVGTEATPPEEGGGRAGSVLEQALDQLRAEKHFPNFERIRIKARGLGVADAKEAQRLLDRAVEKGAVVREDVDPHTVFWWSGGRWEAVDPNDPEDRYDEGQWRAFELSLASLPSHQRTAQTRYHLATHVRAAGMTAIAALAQAEVEHMVHLAVGKGLLERVETPMGPRMSVPIEE